MSSNVVELFFDAAARNERDLAFVSAAGVRARFGELRRAVEGFAAGLIANGLRRGDRAVFMLPMSPELYVGVLGTLASGGVAVFVDPWIPVRQIARLLASAKPIAFVGSPRAQLLRLLERELRKTPITVTTDVAGAWLLARFRFADFQDFAGWRGPAAVGENSPALITYTTGSSGRAKGVNRTHAILSAQHQVIREEFPAAMGDVDLTTFPVFALSNLAAGVTTVIPPVDLRRIADADGAAVVRDIEAFGVTTAAASPPLFDRITDRVRESGAGTSLSRLRRIVTGGAPVRDDQLRNWRSAFPGTEIQVAYGSSEAEPVATISADTRLSLNGARRGFCAGKPVHAVQSRLVRIVSGPIAEPVAIESRLGGGMVGELLVSGPHVCRDYVGSDAANAFAENKVRDADGMIWHRMGDTGEFDDDGRFWIAGRVHTTIRRGGVEYHAQLIESQVRGIVGGVQAVAAVGVPDTALGERLVVVIQTTADARGVRDRLDAAVSEPIDEVHVTRKRLPVDPRHNSKIDYTRLRSMLERGELG